MSINLVENFFLRSSLLPARLSDWSESAAKTAIAKCTAWGIEIEITTRQRKRMFEQ